MIELEFQRQGMDLRVRRATDSKDGYTTVGVIAVTAADADHLMANDAASRLATSLFEAAETGEDLSRVTTGDKVVNRLIWKIAAAARHVPAPERMEPVA